MSMLTRPIQTQAEGHLHLERLSLRSCCVLRIMHDRLRQRSLARSLIVPGFSR